MRNEMPDDNEDGHNSTVARRNRRRKQAIMGVAGLTVLGAGAFLVTSQVVDGSAATRLSDAAAPTFQADGSLASDGASATASPVPKSGGASAVGPSVAPTNTQSPKTAAERAKAARDVPAPAPSRTLRPLPDAGVASINEADVTSTKVERDGETLRTVSAHADLTGYRHLRWAADEGEKVGDVRCTSNTRLSMDVTPRERPTLLLCWRISAQKSVYTLATRITGKPSRSRSIAAIDAAWAKLG
jgi:hypothetical protein